MSSKMTHTFDVCNSKFSSTKWIDTAENIITGIIDCNEVWKTNYTRSDFYINGRYLTCRDEIVAEEI